MEITAIKEPVTATDSVLNGSSFTGVMLRDARFEDAGLRVDGYLVSDLIAAYRKSS